MTETTSRGRVLDGLRQAVTLLTVIPLPGTGRMDRDTARWAMVLAPLIGVVVGGLAALILFLGGRIGFGSGVSAGLAVAAMAALTRGMHLDGLADLADGLGSGRPASGALEVMRRSDIGPFGVITLVLTLLIQVAAIADGPLVGVIVAAVTGRLAVTWACRETVPAARTDGLGSLVARTVWWPTVIVVSAVVVVLAALVGYADEGLEGALLMPGAVVAGVGVAMLVLWHVIRRLGGITGDVLGALVEIATTVALVTMTID